jgi:hypothetical protein
MFEWTDYLAVAQELATPGPASPAEACQRASIGRAYYAVFGHALQVFVELGEYRAKQSGLDHELLPRYLKMSSDHRRREIGETLNRLRPARHWADYVIGPKPQNLMFHTGGPACVKAQKAIAVIDAVRLKP